MVRSKSIALAVCLLLSWLAGCATLVRPEPPAPPALERQELMQSWHFYLTPGWQPGQLPERLTPKVVGDVIYVAHRLGQVAALEAATGHLLWQQELAPLQAGVTVAGERLYVIDQQGTLITLATEDGREIKQSNLNIAALAPPVVHEHRLIMLARDGSLRVWDLRTDSWIWIHDTEQPTLTLHGQMVPMVIDDLVIAGFANGQLVAFQLLSGEIQWAQRLSNPRGTNDLQRLVDVDAQPVLVNGRLYTAGYEGSLVALNPRTGEVSWQTSSSVVASLAHDERTLYVAEYRGDIIAYALPSMAIRWRNQQYRGRPITALTATQEGLVMADRQGYVHLLDTSSGSTRGRFSMVGSQTFASAAQAHPAGFVIQSVQGLVLSGQHTGSQP